MDKFIDGSDIYYHRDSLWIVFTETKEWVIELTNKNTLWYNYRFFTRIFDFVSLDVVENQHYITKWVEDTIQNGVRHTGFAFGLRPIQVEDTIQNGVKETTPSGYLGSIEMKGKIVHQIESPKQNNEVEDTIQNGIKRTSPLEWSSTIIVEDTIQNGIKETHNENHHRLRGVVLTLKDGIKETKTLGDGDIESTMEFMNENNTLDVPKLIEEVITNTTGVKNTYSDIIKGE